MDNLSSRKLQRDLDALIDEDADVKSEFILKAEFQIYIKRKHDTAALSAFFCSCQQMKLAVCIFDFFFKLSL